MQPDAGLALGQLITEVPGEAGGANGEVRFTIVLSRDGSRCSCGIRLNRPM